MWYKLNSCFTSYCNQSTDIKIQHINHLRQLRFSGWQIALHFGTPHNFRLYLSGDLNTRFDFFIHLEKKEKGIDAIFRNPRFWSDEKPQLSMLKLYCSINSDEIAYESINAADVSLSKVMGNLIEHVLERRDLAENRSWIVHSQNNTQLAISSNFPPVLWC